MTQQTIAQMNKETKAITANTLAKQKQLATLRQEIELKNSLASMKQTTETPATTEYLVKQPSVRKSKRTSINGTFIRRNCKPYSKAWYGETAWKKGDRYPSALHKLLANPLGRKWVESNECSESKHIRESQVNIVAKQKEFGI